MGFLKAPKVELPAAPQAPPVPPLAIQQDLRPKKKSMTPTFLGTEATPSFAGAGAPSAGGGKTLLGQ
jgi:hypothetical protein